MSETEMKKNEVLAACEAALKQRSEIVIASARNYLCLQCSEWTPDPWAICADCRAQGFVHPREERAAELDAGLAKEQTAKSSAITYQITSLTGLRLGRVITERGEMDARIQYCAGGCGYYTVATIFATAAGGDL